MDRLQQPAVLGLTMLVVPPKPALVLAAGPADCYFQYESASVLRLIPWGGNQILINGTRYTIPAAGIALASSPSWAGYQILYACLTSSLVISVQDPGTGIVINADGMPTVNGWPLVGAFTQHGGNSFVNTGAVQGCISYYNRRQRRAATTWNASSGQTAMGELVSAARMAVLGFPGDHARIDYSGTMYIDAASSAQGAQAFYSANGGARSGALAINYFVTFYGYSTTHFGSHVDLTFGAATKLEAFFHCYVNVNVGTWYGDGTCVFDG